jgi:hypothetical protein
MLEASRVSYEIAGRTDATAHGGIAAMLQFAKNVGLRAALDEAVQVFKRHFPYHESDHILNIAFNALAGGSCLEDLELRRTDSAYLNALRGDSDFSLTWKFDEWTDARVAFYFGYDTREPLTRMADAIPEKAWKYLCHEPKYPVKTEPRRRPENVKERLVVANEYDNLKSFAEQVAEFAYRPTKCRRDYRVIVLRKHYTLEKGQSVLFASERYFFYITNDWRKSAEEILAFIRERCDHENDLDQLKNGVLALRAPSNTLESNWAFMVMRALAWNLKAWYGLLMPDKIAGAEIVRMEFRRFVNGFMNLPAQVLKAARGIRLRLLAYNRYVEVFMAMFAWIRRLGVT